MEKTDTTSGTGAAGTRGGRSKLSEAAWAALFARDAAGVPRAVLAAEHGVSASAIEKQARRRGLNKRQVRGAVDRRRRPPGGWPDDHVLVQSPVGMTPARWSECLKRYVAGAPIEDLAADYGVSPCAIHFNARKQRMRKCDHPGAVYQPVRHWRGEAARNEYLREVTLDFEDVARARASVAQAIIRALADDDWNAVRQLVQVKCMNDRMAGYMRQVRTRADGDGRERG